MKKQTEDIFEPAVPVVPEGWDVLPFEQTVDVVSDKSKRIKQSAYLPTGKLPVIDQGQEFIGGYTDDEDMAFEGELPVILFGDHTRSIKYVDKPFAVGAEGVKILKPSSGFDPKYLYYLLRSLHIPSRGYSRHFQFLRKFHFQRAPESQQKRIVAEIEKQFSRLDEAVANLKRVKANLRRYKDAVLKAAVEGRLVETEAELARREGRSYETGEQLLQRILEARRSQWQGKGKYKEPAAPDTTDLPELPEGWVCASVDQLVGYLTDGDHQPPPQTDEGIPFLVIGNVRNGEVDFTDTRHVSEVYYESLDPYRKPRQGDLLYTLVGSYGIPVRVKTDAPFCIQRHMAILRPHENSPMEYLALAMASDNVFKQATAVATGTAQKTVPLAGLRKIAIPLPPPAEQLRIVAELERRLSIISGSKAEADVNLKRADRLRQSILEKAFSGQLIPEDSNAEPVSALLARIRIDEEPKQATDTPKASKAKPISKEVTVTDLIEALKDAGDWISAQEAFQRCGVGIGAETDSIELLYAELRDYVKPGIVEVERRGDEDWLRVSPSEGA